MHERLTDIEQQVYHRLRKGFFIPLLKRQQARLQTYQGLEEPGSLLPGAGDKKRQTIEQCPGTLLEQIPAPL